MTIQLENAFSRIRNLIGFATLDNEERFVVSPYIFATPEQDNPGFVTLVDLMSGDSAQLPAQVYQEILQLPPRIGRKALKNKFGAKAVDFLTNHEFLLREENVWLRHRVRRVEIETTTTCNWRCRYCPVSKDPKKSEVMGMELFARIIEKIKRYPTITHVTLHSYSEVTLDPLFEERVSVIKQAGLMLDVYSNASGLNEKKALMLKESGIVDKVIFNLPSMDKKNHESLTGAKTYQKSMENINRVIDMGFNVQFSVNRVPSDPDGTEIEKIRQEFASRIKVPIEYWNTSDRAGHLSNEYERNISLQNERLNGCLMASFQLHIGVKGNLFICCEDYYQNEQFGNIDDGEISDILTSEKAVKLRKYIFGGETAPADFICRKCSTMEMNSNLQRLS